MFKIFRYLFERTRWMLLGYPLRSQKRVSEIFEICTTCPHFSNYQDGTGTCGICGCYIKNDAKDIHFNKASWGTTKCPDTPSRWQ